MKEKLSYFGRSKFLVTAILSLAMTASLWSQNDIKITTVDTAGDQVTLTNVGSTTLDVSGYWLCLGPGTYQNVGAINGGSASIMAGATLTLSYDMDPVSDGLSLFSTNSFGSSDPNVLLDFVQWGAGNQPRSGQAVTAGRWDDASDFIDCPAPYTTINGGNVEEWIASTVSAADISLDNGETMASICVDGTADPLNVNVAAGSVGTNQGWVITDANTNEILALPPSPPFDLDGAGIGVCEIWYIRYEAGTTGITAGNNVSDIEGCFDLSNPITVYRTAPADAAAIEIAGTGETTASICVDGNADPIEVNIVGSGTGENNGWVITDNATGEILALPPASQTTFDLDGAGLGVCDIWYIRYATGTTGIAAGNNVSDIEGCFDLSNPITVYRTEPADAAAIEIAGTGETSTSICVDGVADPIEVNIVGTGVGENNGWVITDNATGEILALPPAGQTTFDLDGAGPGVCDIWYIRYANGTTGIEVGNNVSDIEGCFDLSNPIEVIREEADGGTVSLENGDTEVSICAGDGIPDPLEVIHENPGAENLSYRYVITDSDADNTILGISGSSTIDLEGAGAGICRIWGWSYRGVLDNGAGFIGSPLADLQAESCSDISDDFVQVTRLTGDDCDTLSVETSELELGLQLYPNPASTELQVDIRSLSGDFNFELYDLNGRQLQSIELNAQSVNSINISDLNSGVYLIRLTDSQTGNSIVKRFIRS